ncbi:MAG: response regulator [Gammaproteobacteria bacterium]|nr:response regulator [Gammaproteobacteria bacterium]
MTGKARILFVDDEKRVLNAMRGLFRREYDLFLTCEGAEAIDIVAENEIDVIVADQRMPGMTGIEVLAKIKERSPRTVRILLTGYADPSAVEGSINIGEVFRFLSKPCPPKMLREALALAIEASRTSPQATPTVTAPQAAPKETPAAPADQSRVEEEPLHDNDETQPALLALKEGEDPTSNTPQGSHWQSVTSVVMSEDAVETTQESVALTAASMGMMDVGVVVFTVDSEFAATAIRAVSTERNTVVATTLVKVAQAIETENIGVLVTDFTTNKTTLQKIVGALKQRMPELVTIVVSNGRDTNDMINLINYGQVFRYVLKPIEPVDLRNDINAAVIRHLYLQNNPDSAKRHEVVSNGTLGTASTTVNRFFGAGREEKVALVDPTETIS